MSWSIQQKRILFLTNARRWIETTNYLNQSETQVIMFYNLKGEKPMPEYLKIHEAADLLKITKQTLRNWDKQGKLTPHRHPLNNYRLYKKSDLIKLLNKIEKK